VVPLNDRRRWHIRDPDADLPLDEIAPLGRRARSLVVRSKAPVLNSAFAEIWGAVSMLIALDYHFAQFMAALATLEGRQPADYQPARDEAVAWLNRAGQLHYFMESALVRGQKCPRTPHLNELLVFRHKHSAHRSIDAPRTGDTPDLMFSQAIAFSELAGTLWTLRIPSSPARDRPGVSTHMLRFQVRSSEKRRATLTLETDHPPVAAEAYAVIAALVREGDA
jgi:hypothetical protein